MSCSCCSAQIVAAALVAALAAGLSSCGSVAIFGEYDIPESPQVAVAPWPKLVDTPAAPPVGTYTAAVPDPAEGVLTQADLGAAGAEANARGAGLAAPIVAVDQRAAENAIAAAAAARAAALAGPVISDAERAAMIEAAQRTPPTYE